MDKVRNFAKVGDSMPIPRLDDIQVVSYARFLQADTDPARRKNQGLEGLLKETFPIISYDEQTRLDYQYYELGDPRYTPEECRDLRMTYGMPFRICCRLSRKDSKDVLEESIYLGEVPIMIGGGEFIINGAERVIVSQLHRSPGVDFSVEMAESDRPLHGARVIPERGSWIELAVTKKDSLAMRIDQSGKVPVTTFVRAMHEKYGTDAQIIREFYETQKLPTDELRPQMYVVEAFVDPDSGEELLPAGGQIGEARTKIVSSKTKRVEVIDRTADPLVLNTLSEDAADSHENALLRIYMRLRPGNPPQLDKAKTLFQEKFYDENRYRLGNVGRFRINRKFHQKVPESVMTLRVEDFVNTLKYIMKLRTGEGTVDDIDHLGNRRLRTIDELATEEIRKGFLKLRRTVQERMSLKDPTELKKISDLINSKSVSSSIDFFYSRGELSQVVDQQNPLSQLTHERRLSALGPGGLNRKRAGFEVRDVHISHYGRICPIETPEGNNIGLISSLGIYSGVDEYGFLVTPYSEVQRGKPTGNVVQLRADEEMEGILAPLDALEEGARGARHLPKEHVLARAHGEVRLVAGDEVDYVDISPKQTVGVSAAMIPFLEHDDANRALMGSNMQRQAVPLLRSEPPVVATGMEKAVAANSGMVIKARQNGVITYVDAEKVVIDNTDQYEMRKFAKLNERACLNQKPIVVEGQRVKKGQIIADGSACSQGELALGRNVLVAFMPFDGFNFEDAILISERLVKEDTFTSVHLEEYEVEVRETKLGREEFTRDIPNVSEKALMNLDANGIVRVGTRVGPGDILVGKVSPKSKSELSPEEKLLHAIFGRAGEDVKNDSLELPAGEEGVVVDTRRFSRRMHMSEERKKELNRDIRHYRNEMNARQIKLFRIMAGEINDVLGAPMVDPSTRQKVGESDIDAVIIEQIENFTLKWVKTRAAAVKQQAAAIYERYWPQLLALQAEMTRKLDHMKRGDELPSGVLEMVKIRVATKRRLGVGDKMAGRHGNKGVIARILPEEDMPFLPDGTAVDIVLNPLGVPGRMNLGQILETHLGWAAAVLGFQAVTPVFDGATEEEIVACVREANEHVRQRRGTEAGLTQSEERRLKELRARIEGLRDKLREAEEDRHVWIEDNHTEWRGSLLTSFKFVVTDAPEPLAKRELEVLELAVVLDNADSRPRSFKGARSIHLPRLNAWDPRYEKMFGSDISTIRREVDRFMAGNPRVASLFEECRQAIRSKSGWLDFGKESLAKVPDKQGIYFCRGRDGGVSDGYVGVAGLKVAEGQKQKLKGRMEHHLRDTYKAASHKGFGDNLVKSRFPDEALHLLRTSLEDLEGEAFNVSAKAKNVQLTSEQVKVIQNAGRTRELLVEMPEDCKMRVFDGRTGEAFEQKVTVGYIYMNKLHHLVDEKIHARATGPYSLITQQPLGGKARTGGQRFGEMEVWGLEAYGASFTLQELLTVKSDDVEGRTKIYESMVKGANTLEAGTPVSFDVLCNELRGLGLNIQLEKRKLI